MKRLNLLSESLTTRNKIILSPGAARRSQPMLLLAWGAFAQVATLLGGVAAVSLSASRLLSEANLSLGQVTTLVRSNNFLICTVSCGGMFALYQSYRLLAVDTAVLQQLGVLRDESQRQLNVANSCGDLKEQQRLEEMVTKFDHEMSRVVATLRWGRIVNLGLSVTATVGVVLFVARQQGSEARNETLKLELQRERQQFELNMAAQRASERLVSDWENAWRQYQDLPSGTSVALLVNDTAERLNVFATHPYRQWVGAVNPTDNRVVEPGQMLLLKTNRHGYGLGEGIDMCLNAACVPFVHYKHATVVMAKDFLRTLSAQQK